ncbi:hypothetical protein D3C84_961120 [compost metagenome]
MASDSRSMQLEHRHWEKALNEVNVHITVREEEIEAAKDAYQEVAELLAANLSWPPEAISILPQGSVSTKTLIRLMRYAKWISPVSKPQNRWNFSTLLGRLWLI